MTIELTDGRRVDAIYARHLRTLTNGTYSGNTDLDLFRLSDGSEVVCESPANDGRAVPVQVDMTREEAMFS